MTNQANLQLSTEDVLIRVNMPPSVNDAIAVVGRHIVKSTAHKRYRQGFYHKVISANEQLLTLSDQFISSRGAQVQIVVRYFFDRVLRKRAGQGTIYMKEDIDNRFKILGDCLTTVIGVDDANYFDVRLLKHVTSGPEFAMVYIRELPETERHAQAPEGPLWEQEQSRYTDLEDIRAWRS